MEEGSLFVRPDWGGVCPGCDGRGGAEVWNEGRVCDPVGGIKRGLHIVLAIS